MNKKLLLMLIFFIHFILIFIYSIRETIALSLTHETYISRTIAPQKLQSIDYTLSSVLRHPKSSVKDDYIGFYMTLTGAQTPFNYFVANISGVEKLIFELEFKDGSRQIILPTVSSSEMAVRFKHLLNLIEITPNELYRNLLIKRITEHEIRNYSNLKTVTAILGVVDIPAFSHYTKEQNLQFRSLYQYHYQIK